MSDTRETELPTLEAEQLDRLGRLADKADNYIAASVLPFSLLVHKQNLVAGLKDISQEIKTLYRELIGENPWEDSDE